jgi:serine/threonine-protein kinase HipA
MKKLHIFYRSTLVGAIDYNPLSNEYSFEYDTEWIKNGFELSPALKFKGFKKDAIKLFIENLLPEGESLDDLSRYFQISKSNKFALLKKIGLDTTGALMFLPDDTYNITTSFREVSADELKKRIESKDEEPISIWDKKLRLSVSGVQEKLPISLIGSKMGFGEGDLCSTHILKFNRRGENIILNEYISLKLCKEIGINVANVEYKAVGKENVLYVQRFDRKTLDSDHIQRTHVIDGVQALGLPVSYKYERVFGSNEEVKDFREGVSWRKLFNLSIEAKIPIIYKEQLIIWSIINLCLGNSDAHGKNISFFVDKDGLEIAPFYDIVNITMYQEKYEQDMAMAINDEFTYNIKAYDFLEFLKQNNISKIQYFEYFGEIIIKISKALEKFDFIETKLFKDEKKFCLNYKENIINRINFLVDAVNELRYPKKDKDETNKEFYDDYADDIRKTLNIKKKIDKDEVNIEKIIDDYIQKVEKKSIKKIAITRV